MSILELRQYIESHIPWWLPFAAVGFLICLVIVLNDLFRTIDKHRGKNNDHTNTT